MTLCRGSTPTQHHFFGGKCAVVMGKPSAGLRGSERRVAGFGWGDGHLALPHAAQGDAAAVQRVQHAPRLLH